jgi:hypothetical protein
MSNKFDKKLKKVFKIFCWRKWTVNIPKLLTINDFMVK